jgi:hypothetical protein
VPDVLPIAMQPCSFTSPLPLPVAPRQRARPADDRLVDLEELRIAGPGEAQVAVVSGVAGRVEREAAGLILDAEHERAAVAERDGADVAAEAARVELDDLVVGKAEAADARGSAGRARRAAAERLDERRLVTECRRSFRRHGK